MFNNNHEILSDEENIDPIVVVRNTSIQNNSSNQVLNSHSSKSASTTHSGTKLQKSAKIILKKLWNWLILLMSKTVWQILNIKWTNDWKRDLFMSVLYNNFVCQFGTFLQKFGKKIIMIFLSFWIVLVKFILRQI